MVNVNIKTINPVLAFKKKDANTSFAGKLVCFYTKSDIYHVEISLENKWISANPEKGIYVKDLKPLKNDWVYINMRPIDISEEVLSDIMTWLEKLNGTKYDKWGIFLTQFLGINIYNEKYFCSELVAEILMYLGYKEFIDCPYQPSDFSPNDMYNYLTTPNIKLKQHTLINRIKNSFKSIYNKVSNLFKKDK